MSCSDLNKKTLNQRLPSTEQISNSLLATGDENDVDIFFDLDYEVILQAEPDLECSGSPIIWTYITAGSTVTDSFKVKNDGDPNSELDWKIESYPEWGTWTISPSSGNNLKPEDGQITVDVTVVTPKDPLESYTGTIKVVNTNDGDDFSLISCLLTTPRNKQITNPFITFILIKYPMLARLILTKPFFSFFHNNL
ncbi:MAG: hypothetical protein KAR55_03960 [Thermoplasmatales archaeon]|nr:hypothetical protein [Thermoplasmatales archaeon]